MKHNTNTMNTQFDNKEAAVKEVLPTLHTLAKGFSQSKDLSMIYFSLTGHGASEFLYGMMKESNLLNMTCLPKKKKEFEKVSDELQLPMRVVQMIQSVYFQQLKSSMQRDALRVKQYL